MKVPVLYDETGHSERKKEVSSVGAIDGKITPGVATLWRRYYPNYIPNIFGRFVESQVDVSSHVLEIGAGSGVGQQNRVNLKGKVAKYVGIDLDERVLENPQLDEAFVCSAENLPFDNGSFDVVFHTMVAEHLQNPLAVMRETARVLRTRGKLFFETPNRFYYPMLVAAVTPHWLHVLFVSRFGSGRKSHEVFPTVYRLNDRKSIEAVARDALLEPTLYFHSIPPGYLRFSRVSFLLGVLYERTIERRFPGLRGRITVVAIKKSVEPPEAFAAVHERRGSDKEDHDDCKIDQIHTWHSVMTTSG